MKTELELDRANLLRLVHQELFAQLQYGFPSEFSFTEYHSRGGIDIPFLIQTGRHSEIAIAVDASEGGIRQIIKKSDLVQEEETLGDWDSASYRQGRLCGIVWPSLPTGSLDILGDILIWALL